MKKTTHFLTAVGIILVIGLMIAPAYGAPKQMQQNKGNTGVQTGASCVIGSLPYEELSLEEELGLIKMREEEKLARDVYAALYNIWNKPVSEIFPSANSDT